MPLAKSKLSCSSRNTDAPDMLMAKAYMQVSDLNMACEVKQYTVLIYRQLDLTFYLIKKRYLPKSVLSLTVNATAPSLGRGRKCTLSRSYFPLFFCVADLSAALMKI